MKAKLEKKIDGLIHVLEEIQAKARALEERYDAQLREIHPDQYKSGLNLLHYLALRQHDISELGGRGHELLVHHNEFQTLTF